MTKQKLIEILQKLLDTTTPLEYLRKLEEEELETLVACVRSRLEQR